jgi:hypothetical protein
MAQTPIFNGQTFTLTPGTGYYHAYYSCACKHNIGSLYVYEIPDKGRRAQVLLIRLLHQLLHVKQ